MIPLPREHGAWAMLAISLLAGWRAGGASTTSFLLSFAVVSAFFAQSAWLDHQAGRCRIQVPLLEASCALAAFLGAVWTSGGAVLPAGAVLAAIGLAAGVLRMSEMVGTGRVRLQAWGAHLLGAMALGGIAPLLASAVLDPMSLLRLWLGIGGSYGAGVLLVQTLRGTPQTSKPLFGWCAATLAAWWLLGPGPDLIAILLAWSPIPLRLLATPALRRNRTSWRAIGLLETALGAWSALWTVVSLT